MTGKTHILLAEDDETLAELMQEALEEAGYSVIVCHDGQTAIDCFDKKKTDICLLDVMMPVKDGFTVAKRIRQQSDMVPILFISTRGRIEDKTEGYEKGADDYIVKPFNMKELLLKLEVFLKRTRKLFSDSDEEYTIGQLRFSYTNLQINHPGGTIELKQKEADLLRFLCMHTNRILKREEILLAVWEKDDYFLGRSMDVFMSKLRKHLKADPRLLLETIHGMGYRLSVPAN